MRKMAVLFLSFVIIMVLVACDNGKGADSGDKVTSTQEVTSATQTNALTKPEAIKTKQVETLATQTKGGKKTIVFTTFDYDNTYPKAKKYEKLHPNIKIELNHINYEDQPANDPIAFNEAFVQRLNTQVLSGKGPDLIDTSFLEIDQYVKHKLHVNLSDMMDKDPTFKKEQYFMNILDQVKLGGYIYGMPLNFAMEGLYGDETAIEKTGVKFDDKSWNWSQFTNAAKELALKGNNKYALWGKGPDHMLYAMVEGNYSGYVDEVNKKAYFDSALFTGTLKQIKAMFDEKIITTDHKNYAKTYFQQDSVSPISYILKLKELGNAPYNYKKPKLYAAPKGNDQNPGVSFTMGSKLSIYANSSVKAEAWDFIKFLLSEDSDSYRNIPLNKYMTDK
jgi:multiple sugar transport system substrate-binding protein